MVLVRTLLLVLLTWAASGAVWGESLQQKADEALAKGSFVRAISLYEQLLSQGNDSASLHYNLALAHMGLQHKGEARAHYERAYQLAPWDGDIVHNLGRLKAGLDDAEAPPSTLRLVAASLSARWLFAGFTLAHGALWFGWMRYRRSPRELFLWIAIAGFLGIALFGALAWLRYRTPEQAVVLPASVVLKNGPGREFTESLSLHAGCLVDVVRREGDWTEVEAMGNVRAWIPESDLRRVGLNS